MKDIINLLKNKKLVSFFFFFTIYATLCFENIITTYNLLSILLFIVIYIFIYNAKAKYNKDITILSLMFSLTLIIGKSLYIYRYNKYADIFSEIIKVKNIVFLLGMFFLIYFVLYIIFDKVLKNKIDKESLVVKNKFLFYFAIILICYIPYYLIYYPGILTNDSIGELTMVINEMPISDHHTVFHFLFLKSIFNIGNLFTHNINIIVGMISFVQMVLVVATFSYTLVFLNSRKLTKKVSNIILIYYALFPINAIYSITMWKDIIFSCSMILLTIECIKLLEKHKITVKNSYSFILVSILVVFTRNNAIYMYLVLSFFTIITFRKQLKAIIPMLIIVFGTYLVTKGPVYKALNVQTSSSAEYIAIPLQQIGRMAYKNIKFTTEEENKINKLIPVETLKEVYNPDIVDPIKFHKNYDAAEFEKDKLGYLKLWSSLCIKHPKTAVEAYLISTIGYWYPGTEGFVTTMDIENNSLGIKNSSIIPQGIRNYTSKIQSIRIPLLGFSYCIGFCIWIIGVTAYLIYKKYNRRQLYFITPVFGVWLTMLIATPVASEFRYVYCAYLCLPIFISTLFFQKNK